MHGVEGYLIMENKTKMTSEKVSLKDFEKEIITHVNKDENHRLDLVVISACHS